MMRLRAKPRSQSRFYSGLRREPEKKAAMSTIVHQFDDGDSVFSEPPAFREYDVSGRGADAVGSAESSRYVEYDVLSKGITASQMNIIPVDPDESSARAGRPQPNHRLPTVSRRKKTNGKKAGPAPRASSSSTTKKAPKPNFSEVKEVKERRPVARAKRAPEDKDRKPKIHRGLSNDELLEDMKSILAGEKVYHPQDGVIAQGASQAHSAPNTAAEPAYRPEPAAKPPAPALLPNEHDIFDRIAQSMKYANAYDLGSVAITKRFNDFDQLDDISRQTAKPSARRENTAAPVRQQAAAEPAVRATTEDFLEDLNFLTTSCKSAGDEVAATPATEQGSAQDNGSSEEIPSQETGDASAPSASAKGDTAIGEI